MQIQLKGFLSTAPHGGVGLVSRHSCFTPEEKQRVPIILDSRWKTEAGLTLKLRGKTLAIPENRTPVAQPVA
jgi:hypothetical protein